MIACQRDEVTDKYELITARTCRKISSNAPLSGIKSKCSGAIALLDLWLLLCRQVRDLF